MNNIPPKKNSKRISIKKYSTSLLPSHQFIEWEKHIKLNIDNIVFLDKNEKSIYDYFGKTDLEINAIFFKKSNRKYDLTNIMQSIEDIFTDLKIIDDDNYTILSNFKYKIDQSENNKGIFALIELKPISNENITIKELYSNIYNSYNSINVSKIPQFTYKSKQITKKRKNIKQVLFIPNTDI